MDHPFGLALSATPRRLMSQELDVRRRRLQFRCWHSGTQEIDLVLGSFAETFLERLDSAELERFEALLDCPDVDLFDWIFVGIAPPPQHDHGLTRLLRDFHVARHHGSRHPAQHQT